MRLTSFVRRCAKRRFSSDPSIEEGDVVVDDDGDDVLSLRFEDIVCDDPNEVLIRFV